MGQTTVLLVNWFGSYGGAEKYQFDIVRGCDQSRYRFILASPRGDFPPRWVDAGYSYFEAPTGPGLDLRSVWRLHRIMRQERVDIVHAMQSRTLLQAGLAARLIGKIGVIQTEYNITMNWHRVGAYPWYVRYINNPIRRLVGLHLADQIVSVSQSGRQFYLDVIGLPTEKVCVIPAPMAVAPEHPAPTNAKPMIGTAAELTERKGLLDLVDAAQLVVASHPDAQFLIMGRGHLEARLKERIAAKGLGSTVHLLGFVPDASDRMAQWDIFVLPSISDLFPRAILEAMAQGLAVISTTVDGALDMVVNGETGLLVPPADPPALAQAIIRLLDDPALARQMGRKGRARVAQVFNVEGVVQRIDALYQDVLRRRK
jgi:glycosyltransferase involved in cell wall biosynthesis